MNYKEDSAHNSRPVFPERAVVTAGMPYGNKELHIGHIGGVFIHADTYARFLRDRIGRDNVIFVSGTDCYGSPIYEHHRQLVSSGEYEGSIEEFVADNHKKQKEALEAYNIDLSLFAASGMEPAKDIHESFTGEFIKKLYSNGHLKKVTTLQFYDLEYNTFLNGRQVIGRCPIEGCSSEKGYADECSLGHQYMPSELINPISTLSGKTPEMRQATNWYFKLDEFQALLKTWLERFEEHPAARSFSAKNINEFLEPPVIYVKKEYKESIESIKNELPEFNIVSEPKKSSSSVVFKTLEDREAACSVLSAHSIRYRTGKTLVPFRLTGNIDWGVPAPTLDELYDLTVWVWPESLFAPISFTKTYLSSMGKDPEGWRDWWSSKRSTVYQFIGVDNVYFYGPAEMAMFMGYNRGNASADSDEGELQLPMLIVNNHLLFLNSKASSSGKIKPPMASELLGHYTAEQLRAHFLGLGLSLRSVSFDPKPFNPSADTSAPDPVLKEGNLLTNVFNRFARTCFYTSQNHYDGRIPIGEVSDDIANEAGETVLKFESLMHKCQFHLVMDLMDSYIRQMNKYSSKYLREADTNNDESLRKSTLVNMFHMLRTSVTLMHSIAPEGTEMILEYLNLDGDIWSWDSIFEPIYSFIDDMESHRLKFLPPRTDFFTKHPSQFR